MNRINYSIVIPVYKSNQHIAKLINFIETYFSESLEKIQILFIIDGCKQDYAFDHKLNKHAEWKVVYLKQNYGQKVATLCGLALSDGDQIITMDADMYTIDNLFSKTLHLNAALIYADLTYVDRNYFRKFGSFLYSAMIKMSLGFEIGQHNGSSYRIINHTLKNKLLDLIPSPSQLDICLLQNSNSTIFEAFPSKVKSTSSYNIIQLGLEIIKLMVVILPTKKNTKPFDFRDYIAAIKPI